MNRIPRAVYTKEPLAHLVRQRQMAMPRHRINERRHHGLQALAANPVGGFP